VAVEKMGATCAEKLIGLPLLLVGGASSGIIKSYLQPFISNENKIEIRNIVRFFIVYIFRVNIKKGSY
jgi:hypothetical protein